MGYSWTCNPEEVRPWLEAGLGQKYPLPGRYIGVKFNGKFILAVKYDNFTSVSVQAHIVKEDSAYIPARFFYLIFWYPFIQLKLPRVFISVASGNVKSLNLAQRFGFKEVARISGMLETEDFIWLKLLPEDCLCLGKVFQKKESLLKLEFK